MKATQTLLAAALLFTATGAAHAALVSVLGGQAVNDTDLNVTWAANANLAATNSFSLAYNTNLGTDIYGYQSVIYSDGSMTWGGAQKWIAAMNASNGGLGYLGYNDWRLPTTLQPDASCGYQSDGVSKGYNCTGSEMGHLFYSELGQVAGQSISSSTDPDKAKFTNVQSSYYWSGTEYAPVPANAWDFRTDFGYQRAHIKDLNFYALAVRPGQVAAVPVPAAAWLLGSGLLGLIGVVRRRLVIR